ncbi:MAG TPA: NifB/NifX family molybdenum-iron cluster-binding protein [Spirochaetota bacterium]|nr:NifB/NifX family molybdenum-iron cluster-binding protein [Spirochaetota bacterium]
METEVDPRFGRCRYFIFVDTDTMSFDARENGAYGASGGAGVQSGKFVADGGSQAVLTGNVGPKAYGTLTAAGVEIITGASGVTVKQAVENYLAGKYRPVTGATVAEHSGLRR